jgi:CDP-diglyceride synthetase
MKVRILSATVLTIILVGALAGGKITMFILSLFCTAVGMMELYRVADVHKKAIGISGYVLAAAYYAMLWFDLMEHMALFAVMSAIVIMAMIFKYYYLLYLENITQAEVLWQEILAYSEQVPGDMTPENLEALNGESLYMMES